uniref:Trichohyalin-like n=1 Tax=Globodera pallida TaxID=36090 RepID=A0A183CFB8_GLOPA
MLHEPFSFRLMEINSKCAAVFQSLDLLPAEMEQIFVQFDQFLKEKIYPISKSIDAFLSTVRECAQIARESARSCAIFSQWSREFGDQLQLQPNWELMFYKVQDLQSRFRENGLAKHWLPPSLSPLLQVLIFEHRNRIEEQKRQERAASEALAQATRKIAELEALNGGTKLDDDGKQKPEVPRIELPTLNIIEEKAPTPLQSARSSRVSARRGQRESAAAITDDEDAQNLHETPRNDDTPKTPPSSVGDIERKIAVVKRQIEHDEEEPWGDKAEMDKPWGDKAEMDEPWGDKAEMDEPDKTEEEPWGDKAEQQGKMRSKRDVTNCSQNELNKKQDKLKSDQSELKKNQNVMKQKQDELKKDQNKLKNDQSELKKNQNELKKDQNKLKMNMKLKMKTLDELRHQQRSARSSLSRKIDDEADFSNVPRRNSENFEQNAKNKMAKLNLAKQNGDEARDGGFVTVREAKLTNKPEADDVKEFEWIERMVKRSDGIKLHGVEMKQDEETHQDEGIQPDEVMVKEEVHPEEEVKTKLIHPDETEKETHPEKRNSEERNPEDEKEETHPEKRNPEEGKEETHPEKRNPEEGKEETHPEEGKEETHPEEGKEDSHPDETEKKLIRKKGKKKLIRMKGLQTKQKRMNTRKCRKRKRMNPEGVGAVLEQAGDELESSAILGAVVPELNSGNAHELSQSTILEFWELFRNLANLLEVEVPSRAHVLSRPESAGEREARQRAMASIMDRLKNVLDELRRIGGKKRIKRLAPEKQSKSVEADEIGQSDL